MCTVAKFAFRSLLAVALLTGAAAAKVKPPALDPKRIVNESFGFLKEREPAMTESEYALYERVVPMAKENPVLVLQMLEGMVAGAEPPSPAFSFVLGNVYYAQDRIEAAEGHYRKAVERHPEFQRAWSNLGLLYYGSNRFEDAVRCLSRAVALGDHEGRTLNTLAYSHYRAGNPLSAELIYLQAVTVEPNETASISALVSLLLENREFARAEPLARRLLRLKPSEKMHWSLYAGLLAATDRRIEACATLELASSLGLADRDLLIELGDLYAENGNYTEAEAIYRKLDALSPGEGTGRLLARVRALAAAGQVQEALVALEKIPPPAAGDLRISYLRTVASLRQAQADWPAARNAWEELLARKPADGDAWFALGRNALQTGDTSRAEQAFAEVLKQTDFAYAANLELANLALRSRHYKKSLGYLEAALAIERSPGLVRHAAQIRTYLAEHE